MSAIKKILVPVDFSKSSEAAGEYVARFCQEDTEKEVTFIHVSNNDGTHNQSEVEGKLASYSEKLQAGCKASSKFHVESGTLNHVVLSLQKKDNYDLIIMGTKGSKEDEEVASTNTSQLVLEADCPVLVVPEDNANFSINNIALALGKSEIDDTFALGVLHDIARDNDAKVHILTIDAGDDSTPIGDDKNESVLEYYLETLDYRHSFPKNSDIEEGINNYVKDKSIDLLAILPRNHAKKSKPSQGRLTKLLTLRSEVPVLTID